MAGLKVNPPEFPVTPAEALVLWRRRKQLTQMQAAEHFGCAVDRVRAWEAGEAPSKPPKCPLGVIKMYERCFILRRRTTPKMTQPALAERLGVSKLWVLRMEEGTAPVDRLVTYWKL